MRITRLLLVCLSLCLCFVACGRDGITSTTPLPPIAAKLSDLRTNLKPVAFPRPKWGPTATNTAAPSATSTAAPVPTPTAPPNPTPVSFIMPAYPPGGTYNPNMFKLVVSTPCLAYTASSGGLDLLLVMGSQPGLVSAALANAQGNVVQNYELGTFDPGWHGIHVSWSVAPQPAFVWLTADVEGTRYVSDWCSVLSR